jgi:hypothetical protein
MQLRRSCSARPIGWCQIATDSKASSWSNCQCNKISMSSFYVLIRHTDCCENTRLKAAVQLFRWVFPPETFSKKTGDTAQYCASTELQVKPIPEAWSLKPEGCPGPGAGHTAFVWHLRVTSRWNNTVGLLSTLLSTSNLATTVYFDKKNNPILQEHTLLSM